MLIFHAFLNAVARKARRTQLLRSTLWSFLRVDSASFCHSNLCATRSGPGTSNLAHVDVQLRACCPTILWFRCAISSTEYL